MTSVGRGMAVAVLVVVSSFVVEAVMSPAQENAQVHLNRISKQVDSIRHTLEEHEKLNVRVMSQAAQSYLEESGNDGADSGTEVAASGTEGAASGLDPGLDPDGDWTVDLDGVEAPQKGFSKQRGKRY